MIVEPLNEADRANMKSRLPAPVRMVYRFVFQPPGRRTRPRGATGPDSQHLAQTSFWMPFQLTWVTDKCRYRAVGKRHERAFPEALSPGVMRGWRRFEA